MQPSRRTLLRASVLALAGSGGCLGKGSPASGSATQTTADEPSKTTASSPVSSTPASGAGAPDIGTKHDVGNVAVSVSNLAVHDAVLSLDSPDSMAVATPDDDERYVLVDVSGSESGPPPTAFSLVVDGERFGGRVDITGYGDDVDGRGVKYDPSSGTDSGWVAFVVPAPFDASNGRITLDYGSETVFWGLDERHLTALERAKARFELREVDIPETVTVNERVSVRIGAENVSDVPGTFRGVLNVSNLEYAYAPYPFDLRAESGETVVWEKTFDETPPESVESIGFILDTVAGGQETWAPVQVGTAVGTATASNGG